MACSRNILALNLYQTITWKVMDKVYTTVIWLHYEGILNVYIRTSFYITGKNTCTMEFWLWLWYQQIFFIWSQLHIFFCKFCITMNVMMKWCEVCHRSWRGKIIRIPWWWRWWWWDCHRYFKGLMQERPNSIANTLEFRLSCTNPSILVIQYIFTSKEYIFQWYSFQCIHAIALVGVLCICTNIDWWNKQLIPR